MYLDLTEAGFSMEEAAAFMAALAMCEYKEAKLNGVVKCGMDGGECRGEDDCCWITGYYELDEFEATGALSD